MVPTFVQTFLCEGRPIALSIYAEYVEADTPSAIELVTLREVADTLRVSERTVRRMIDQSELHAFRVGGQLRIWRPSVSSYLNRVRIS